MNSSSQTFNIYKKLKNQKERNHNSSWGNKATEFQHKIYKQLIQSLHSKGKNYF